MTSVFADDVYVVGDTLDDMGNVLSLLETEVRKVGLQINVNKAK